MFPDAPGKELMYPPHPACLCVLVPVHEQPEEFVQRLKRWQDNPDNEPELEKWYNDVSFKEQPRKTESQQPAFLRVNKHDQAYNDTADRKQIDDLEYDKGKAVALIEYKHEQAPTQYVSHPTYQALIDLGNRADLFSLPVLFSPGKTITVGCGRQAAPARVKNH